MGGPNDAALAEPKNPISDTINAGVNWFTEHVGGYDTRRVTDSGGTDNPFYRDNAQYMPGWGNTFGLDFMDPHGLPSGATAQDRATNYVGQNDPTGVWQGVRQHLVQNEGAAINSLPTGPDGKPQGNISFTDVYQAHVDAYGQAQDDARARDPNSTANNSFVDPASFALAMYGAPLMEHFGINAGPITGASIDYFNDPTDTATGGWAKRMGLNGTEMAAGAAMMTNPITFLPGLATAGLGAFGAVWNTGSAIKNGMLGEWGDAIGGAASSAYDWAGEKAGQVGGAISDGVSWAGDKAGQVGSAISDGASSAWNTVSDW